MGAVIRVFLLDDHEVVRRGVGELLDNESDLEVVGEASTAAEALARVPAVRPDVAVLDVRLPDGDGVTVCRELRSRLPELRCLMLTSFADDEALFDAIMAGAAGYVLKQIRGTELVDAIRTVATGQSLLDPRTTSRMLERMRATATRSDPLAELTDQERTVLESDRRGADQPGDRRAHVPGREDSQELRVPPARQAGHAAADPGRGPRHRAAPQRPLTRWRAASARRSCRELVVEDLDSGVGAARQGDITGPTPGSRTVTSPNCPPARLVPSL